jgi:hypothetical protein
MRKIAKILNLSEKLRFTSLYLQFLADKTVEAMEAEAEQERWVSVTYASMTASVEGAGGSVWQWLKPEVVSNKVAPGGGTRRDGAGVKGTPPSVRMAHTASALGASGSEVLVFGGLSDTQKTLRDAFLLNTSTPNKCIYLRYGHSRDRCPTSTEIGTRATVMAI